MLLGVNALNRDRLFVHECDAKRFAIFALRPNGSIGKPDRFDHLAAFVPAETAERNGSPLDLVTGGTGFRTGESATLVNALWPSANAIAKAAAVIFSSRRSMPALLKMPHCLPDLGAAASVRRIWTG
jgi:hypothetical protein